MADYFTEGPFCEPFTGSVKGRRSRSEPLTVWHEYVAVDEAQADAVRERQAKALVDVLRWLAENRQADPVSDGPADLR